MKTLKDLKYNYNIYDIGEVKDKIFGVPSDYKLIKFSNELIIKTTYTEDIRHSIINYFYVNLNTKTIELYEYSRHDYTFNYIYKVANVSALAEDSKEKNTFNIDYKCSKITNKQSIEKSFNDCIFFLRYISYIITEKATVYKTIGKKKTSNKSDVAPSGATTRKQIQILNGDKIIYLETEKNITDTKREYKRYCKSWLVQGHKRQYKDKIIFVKPYIKGNKKEKINQKIYKIN